MQTCELARQHHARGAGTDDADVGVEHRVSGEALRVELHFSPLRGVATIVRVVLNGSKRDSQVVRELRDNVHIALVVRDARGLNVLGHALKSNQRRSTAPDPE